MSHRASQHPRKENFEGCSSIWSKIRRKGWRDGICSSSIDKRVSHCIRRKTTYTEKGVHGRVEKEWKSQMSRQWGVQTMDGCKTCKADAVTKLPTRTLSPALGRENKHAIHRIASSWLESSLKRRPRRPVIPEKAQAMAVIPTVKVETHQEVCRTRQADCPCSGTTG